MKVEEMFGADTRANQPTPSADAIGQMYFVSDEDIIERWNGSAWVQVAANGGGTPSGTAFPGSPTSGDLFYRTNVRDGMLFRYDGTRWVSDQEFWVGYTSTNAINDSLVAMPLPKDYKVWVTAWDEVYYTGSAGACVVKLQKMTWDESYPDLSSHSWSVASSKWESYTTAVGAEVDATGGLSAGNVAGLCININITANVYMGFVVRFRLIAT